MQWGLTGAQAEPGHGFVCPSGVGGFDQCWRWTGTAENLSLVSPEVQVSPVSPGQN